MRNHGHERIDVALCDQSLGGYNFAQCGKRVIVSGVVVHPEKLIACRSDHLMNLVGSQRGTANLLVGCEEILGLAEPIVSEHERTVHVEEYSVVCVDESHLIVVKPNVLSPAYLLASQRTGAEVRAYSDTGAVLPAYPDTGARRPMSLAYAPSDSVGLASARVVVYAVWTYSTGAP